MGFIIFLFLLFILLNVIYKLEFYLGSDYKMLRCLYGHKSPNASEGCVWCHCDLRKDIITF